MKSILLTAMFIGCNSFAAPHQTVHNPPPGNPTPHVLSVPEGGSPYSYLVLAGIAMLGAIRLAKHAKKNS
jgi:hypothetical protein